VLQDPLPDVRRDHRRQGDRDVVDGDRQLHPGEQELGERLRIAERVQERMPDVRVQVADPGQWVGRVDDARPQREPLHPVPLPLVDDQGRGAFVDLEDESWAWHRAFGLLSR
jgi:hypothetical protein